MGTARELITRSFRLLGTHAQGETPSSDEMNDGLTSLIEMLDMWSADGGRIHNRVKDELVLTPGTSQYTFGTGGDLNSARPSKIISAVMKEGNLEYPMELITVEEWSKIPLKTTQGDLPHSLYVEGTFPLETLNLYYTPDTANTLVLYSEKPFSTLTLGTTIQFPPAYTKAIRYGLAIELAPEYGVQLTQEIYQGYESSMMLIEQQNTQDHLMDADPLRTGTEWDYRTGEYW